jgi:hypothetical protein
MSANTPSYDRAVSLLTDMTELALAACDAKDASLRERAFAHLEFFAEKRVQPALKKLGYDHAPADMMRSAHELKRERAHERKRLAQIRREERREAEALRKALASGKL